MKVEGDFHEAAFMTSSRGTPLNQAVEEACALTSCALGDSSGEAKRLISSTNQREIVSLEAGVYGERGSTNIALEVLKVFVFSKYHFNDRTGQTKRSSLIDEMDEMVGRNIGVGENDTVWFFARKCGLGSR